MTDKQSVTNEYDDSIAWSKAAIVFVTGFFIVCVHGCAQTEATERYSLKYNPPIITKTVTTTQTITR